MNNVKMFEEDKIQQLFTLNFLILLLYMLHFFYFLFL
jgi:hypothetical protein